MIDLLVENPLLLLFVTLGIGYLVGRINIGGFSLGISAVLFVGLALIANRLAGGEAGAVKRSA